MKVTVCFDDVRVVVPCGTGEISVGELIQLAIQRYKKAAGKAQDVWVTVHHLKSSDGGILDSDDRVADVVDDKEQISAIYDVSFRSLHQNNGDGTSASSVGTSSPDVFHSGKDYHGGMTHWQQIGDYQDVLITDQDLATESSLTVRRGSEPSLEVIQVDTSTKRPFALTTDPSIARSDKDKLISHQVVADVNSQTTENASRANNDRDSPGDSFTDSAFRAFMRTASRKSLNNGTAMMKWLEAQERVQDGFTRKTREEPIGSSDEAEIMEYKAETENESSSDTLVEIRNSGCPLGIHVTPSLDENNRNLGLRIIDIEPDGLAGADKRLNVNDCITEINGTSLIDVDYSRAQKVFRNALQSSMIRLKIRPSSQRSDLPFSPDGTTLPEGVVTDCTNSGTNDANTSSRLASDGRMENSDNATIDQTAVPVKSKAASATTARTSATTISTKSKFAPIASTRIIGQILKISLKKGEAGLGFSVTTRDNPAGGDCPIYIKNILPHGAAILDGRLRSGDRLLEVNGAEMSGKSQTDVVAILRDVRVGRTVDLVVSRLTDDDQSHETTELLRNNQDGQKETSGPKMNQVLTEKKCLSPAVLVVEDSTVIRLKIPVAGQGTSLGIQLTGKTDQEGRDIGLFVKLILEGGAAAQDGRLRPEDQLIEVNGESLLGFSNVEAMDILLKAVSKDTSKDGVSLAVSRAAVTKGSSREHNLLQKGNNKTESRPGDQEAFSFAHQKNILPSDGQNSNPVSDENSRASDCRLAGNKVWRNVSYMMATDESLLNEMNGGSATNEETKTVLVFPIQEMSGLWGRPTSHCSSLSDYDGRELTKRSSVSTRSSDQESDYSSRNRPKAFERDGFGRRSMSEKRKAFVDPKSSAFYQKLKDEKGQSEDTNLKRTGSVESLMSQNERISKSGHHGVRRGHADNRTKRSHSLKKVEDLQDQGSSAEPHPAYPVPPNAKFRPWNESFRVAIDRSYGSQALSVPQESHRMDPVGSQSQGQGPLIGQETYLQGVTKKPVPRHPPPYQSSRQHDVRTTHGLSQASNGQIFRQPGATTGHLIGQKEHYYNSSNRQTKHMIQPLDGYHCYVDAKSIQKMNDPYFRSSSNHVNQNVIGLGSIIHDQYSREPPTGQQSIEPFTKNNVKAFEQYLPHSGPRAATPPHSQSHPATWDQGTPCRTMTTPSNRPVCRSNNYREVKTLNAEPPTCDSQPNDYMNCDSYPNLTSFPAGYLNDVTNVTKSLRDLSSVRGASQGTCISRTPINPWTDLQGVGQGAAVGGSLNRLKNQTKMKTGFTISSGALV